MEPVPADAVSTGALSQNEGQLEEAREGVSAQLDFANDSLIVEVLQSSEELTVQHFEGVRHSPSTSEASELELVAETRIGTSTPEPTVPFVWEGGVLSHEETHSPIEVGFHEYIVYVTLPGLVESSPAKGPFVTEIRIEDDGNVSVTQVEDPLS